MTVLLRPPSSVQRLLAAFASSSSSSSSSVASASSPPPPPPPPPSSSAASMAASSAASSSAAPTGPSSSSSSSSCSAPGTLSAAFVTCPNQMVAREIARALVENRLAACVNLIPQITSIYKWKGKIEEDSEVLLMIKTRSSRISALADFIRKVHPYEVAEVIAVPIQQGNPPYLRWVEEAVPEEKAPE